MPRRPRLIRLSHVTTDGRRFSLEEVPGGRNPQIRVWNPQTRRYRRMSLDVSLRDAEGRASPALARAALDAAEATILSQLRPPTSEVPRIVTLEDALRFACNPETTRRRRGLSEQAAEWRRAAEEARAVLPAASLPLAGIRPRDAALVGRSALLRVRAGASIAQWTGEVRSARERLGGEATHDEVLIEAHRTVRTGRATAASTLTSTTESPTRGWVWARRAPELLRAMLRHAGAEEEDAYAAVATFALPPDLGEQLKSLAERVGYDTDDEAFRPRHAVDQCRALLQLLTDPRHRMWTCLAFAVNGPGATRALRSHLRLEERPAVRRNHGSASKPLWGWAPLDERCVAVLRAMLANEYAALEHEWQTRRLDYGLVTGVAWTGSALARDADAALPDIDPRFRLVMMLGAEGRATQVARLRRSDVRYLADTREALLCEPGAGTKNAPMLLLGASQLDALAFEMQLGFLREYEDAYQRREIDDYVFFPGGRLVGGRATCDGDAVALNERTLNDWAHELEDALGLERVAQRALRAWRRTFVDLYRGWNADAVALDLITGHQTRTIDGHGSTRTEVYLDRKSLVLLREAQAVTEHARSVYVRTGAPPRPEALRAHAQEDA
jgi:hypothetical protein